MINFKSITDNIAAQKSTLEELNNELYDQQQQLQRIEGQLGILERYGDIALTPPVVETDLVSAKSALQSSISSTGNNIRITEVALDQNLQELATVDPTVLIENLDDSLPILLLPIRVETKFLKVRSTIILPRPAVQVEVTVLQIEESGRKIIRGLQNILDSANMDPASLDPVIAQLDVVYQLVHPINELEPLEKQRIDNLVNQIQRFATEVIAYFDNVAATLQHSIDAIATATDSISSKNKVLTKNIDRIKKLANPLLNLPLGGVSNDLVNALNSLANTIDAANKITYTDVSQILSSETYIQAGLDEVITKTNLITSALSTIQINGIVVAHTQVETLLSLFNNIVESIRNSYVDQLNRIVDTRKILNTEVTKIITKVTTITVTIAQPPITEVTTTDELWVRFYPDDIAVDDLEKALTQEEYDAGKKYWDELWAAKGDRSIELGLWRNLVNRYGSPRTAYIVKTLTPSNYKILVPNQRFIDAATSVNKNIENLAYALDRVPVEPVVSEQAGAALTTSITELSDSLRDVSRMLPQESNLFRQTVNNLQTVGVDVADTIVDSGVDTVVQNILITIANAVETQTNFLTTFINTTEVVQEVDQTNYSSPPAYPQNITIKNDSWTQAPVSRVMPDRFVVSLYKNGQKSYEVVGNPISDTITVGINPNDNDEYYTPDENGDFTLSPDLKWIYDFEEAVKVGMAVRVKITEDEANPNSTTSGFDKITVLGIKAANTPDVSKKAIEDLFDSHHYTGKGFKLIPQGTPTNNTDKKASGFLSVEIDPETSFKVERFGAQYINTTNVLSKADGQWLTEALGINMNAFQNIMYSPGLDIRDAIAMNMALWQGTMGTYLEEMFNRLLTVKDIKTLRSFFVTNVKGRGGLPSLQVADQPYGIIPATAYSRLNLKVPSSKQDSLATADEVFLQKIKTVVVDILGEHWKTLATSNVKSINDFISGSGDALSSSQAGLMGMLGLHAASEEYYQRYSAGQGYAGNFNSLITTAKSGAGTTTWNQTEWENLVNEFDDIFGALLPTDNIYKDSNIFNTTFLQSTRLLSGQLVDRFPLSEARQVNNINNVPTNINYIKYLFETTLNNIKDDITNKTEPSSSLLYIMLRYAQFMQYWDASMEVLIQGGYLNGETAVGNGDRKGYRYFNGAGTTSVPPRSKWFYLFTDMFGLRGRRNETLTMAEYLETDLIRKYPVATAGLKDFKKALYVLQDLSTAKLERVFTEHLDVCSHRLDAWYLGLTHKHLINLRSQQQKKSGIYLGAYGYLEAIKPAARRKDLQGNDIVYGYNEGNPLPVSKAPGNQGYIHGPSLGHAITAAILRNGYITHSTSDNPGLMAVDISSERVRKAMFYIEGVTSGQPLSALLGYQFERALRDKYDVALAMQLWVYELRKLFPLAANKIASTQTSTKPVENLAADNVIDGLKMIEAFKTQSAPFTGGTVTLPNLTDSTVKTGIIAEINSLLDALDALADLTLAEGVFQLSQGNAERSHAVMDALAQANKPIPTPEIINTPRSGTSITNRVSIGMNPIAKPVDAAGLSTTVLSANPWPTVTMTPRALSELSLNSWLGSVIASDPTTVRCQVKYANATTPNSKTTGEILLNELLLQPIDLMYGMGAAFDIEEDDGELATLMIYHTKRKYNLADDAIVNVNFRARTSGWPTSTKTFYELAALMSNLHGLISSSRTLAPDDLILPGGTSGAGATDITELYNRVKYPRPTSTPSQPANQGTSNTLTVMNSMAAPIMDIAGTAVPIPPQKYQASAGAYNMLENILIRLVYYFSRLGANDTIANEFTQARSVLYEASTFGIPQAIPLSITGSTDSDKAALRSQIDTVVKIIRSRLAEFLKTNLQNQLPTDKDNGQTTKLLIDAMKLLFDNTINVLPLFTLHNPVEMQAAYQQRTSILPANDSFAVDKWMRGVAKVRTKMNTFERVATLYDLFGNQGVVNNQSYNQFELSVMQLSFNQMDFWAGYYFGPDKEIDSEVMCFMMTLPPNYSAGTGSTSNNHVGLLIDDWVEMIPNKAENTGVAVHYDQPNAKAPQSILLAVSPEVSGNWKWDNLSSTLLETMELAKIRAVEPDHFNQTTFPHHNLFSQIFPGIVSEVSQENATISKDLSANINKELSLSTD